MEDGSSKKIGFIDFVSRIVTGKRKITEEEVHDFIEATEEEGLVNEEESEMIRSIFALRNTVVREVMVPRMDMACISADVSIDELLDTIIECGHSRIPVYEQTIDNVIGILYAKDLLRHWGHSPSVISLRSIMRVPFFVPETKNLEELLQEFKRKRIHLAVVIDEYGGTSGLITIEDLLEQIVGDIQDEYDNEEDLYTIQADGSIVADGRMPVDELGELFKLDIERDKFDSLGGLIFHLSGKIPAVGDTVHGDGLVITILDADKRKVKKASVIRVAGPVTEEPGDE